MGPSPERIPGLTNALGQDSSWIVVTRSRANPDVPRGRASYDLKKHDDGPPRKKARKKVRKKNDPVKEEDDLIVRKVRIGAKPQQRAKLKQWMGAARWVYNRVVHHLQNYGNSALKELRQKFVHNAAFEKEHTWMLDVPYDVRDGALQDAVTAYKTGKKKQKENPNFKFTLKFRSKKATSESIYVCSRAFKEGTIYKKFGLGQLSYLEDLPAIQHDCRLQRTNLGHLYMCVPVSSPPQPPAILMPPLLMGENQAQEKRVVALDTGVRTFLTGYDPSGRFFEIAPGSMKRIVKYSLQLPLAPSHDYHSLTLLAHLSPCFFICSPTHLLHSSPHILFSHSFVGCAWGWTSSRGRLPKLPTPRSVSG